MDLFSLLFTSHNYYSGLIRSILSIMASERLNLPPVLSVARIIQPANEDTALGLRRRQPVKAQRCGAQGIVEMREVW